MEAEFVCEKLHELINKIGAALSQDRLQLIQSPADPAGHKDVCLF